MKNNKNTKQNNPSHLRGVSKQPELDAATTVIETTFVRTIPCPETASTSVTTTAGGESSLPGRSNFKPSSVDSPQKQVETPVIVVTTTIASGCGATRVSALFLEQYLRFKLLPESFKLLQGYWSAQVAGFHKLESRDQTSIGRLLLAPDFQCKTPAELFNSVQTLDQQWLQGMLDQPKTAKAEIQKLFPHKGCSVTDEASWSQSCLDGASLAEISEFVHGALVDYAAFFDQGLNAVEVLAKDPDNSQMREHYTLLLQAQESIAVAAQLASHEIRHRLLSELTTSFTLLPDPRRPFLSIYNRASAPAFVKMGDEHPPCLLAQANLPFKLFSLSGKGAPVEIDPDFRFPEGVSSLTSSSSESRASLSLPPLNTKERIFLLWWDKFCCPVSTAGALALPAGRRNPLFYFNTQRKLIQDYMSQLVVPCPSEAERKVAVDKGSRVSKEEIKQYYQLPLDDPRRARFIHESEMFALLSLQPGGVFMGDSEADSVENQKQELLIQWKWNGTPSNYRPLVDVLFWPMKTPSTDAEEYFLITSLRYHADVAIRKGGLHEYLEAVNNRAKVDEKLPCPQKVIVYLAIALGFLEIFPLYNYEMAQEKQIYKDLLANKLKLLEFWRKCTNNRPKIPVSYCYKVDVVHSLDVDGLEKAWTQPTPANFSPVEDSESKHHFKAKKVSGADDWKIEPVGREKSHDESPTSFSPSSNSSSEPPTVPASTNPSRQASTTSTPHPEAISRAKDDVHDGDHVDKNPSSSFVSPQTKKSRSLSQYVSDQRKRHLDPEGKK